MPNTENGTQPSRANCEYTRLPLLGLVAFGFSVVRQTIWPVAGSTTVSRPACQRSLIRLLRFQRLTSLWPQLPYTS
ncbi:hypothetical protein D3C80_1971800 [compost metagenome]